MLREFPQLKQDVNEHLELIYMSVVIVDRKKDVCILIFLLDITIQQNYRTDLHMIFVTVKQGFY